MINDYLHQLFEPIPLQSIRPKLFSLNNTRLYEHTTQSQYVLANHKEAV